MRNGKPAHEMLRTLCTNPRYLSDHQGLRYGPLVPVTLFQKPSERTRRGNAFIASHLEPLFCLCHISASKFSPGRRHFFEGPGSVWIVSHGPEGMRLSGLNGSGPAVVKNGRCDRGIRTGFDIPFKQHRAYNDEDKAPHDLPITSRVSFHPDRPVISVLGADLGFEIRFSICSGSFLPSQSPPDIVSTTLAAKSRSATRKGRVPQTR
jgi:hypothetical protein